MPLGTDPGGLHYCRWLSVRQESLRRAGLVSRADADPYPARGTGNERCGASRTRLRLITPSYSEARSLFALMVCNPDKIATNFSDLGDADALDDSTRIPEHRETLLVSVPIPLVRAVSLDLWRVRPPRSPKSSALRVMCGLFGEDRRSSTLRSRRRRSLPAGPSGSVQV